MTEKFKLKNYNTSNERKGNDSVVYVNSLEWPTPSLTITLLIVDNIINMYEDDEMFLVLTLLTFVISQSCPV